jgi:quercetin dioxygenase-like cupin family protein
MKQMNDNFLIGAELPWENPAEGITRQVMGYDGQLRLVKVKFEKGSIGYMHDHFHSQSSFVASGKFEVVIKGKKRILEAGDGFYTEPNAPHGVVCLEEGIIIDAFSPMRRDFL